jgi:uncharacterized protein (DUF1919 family)
MEGFQIYLLEEFTQKYNLPFCGVIAEGNSFAKASENVQNYFMDKLNIDKTDVEQIIKIIGSVKPLEIDKNDTRILAFEELNKY